MASPVPEGLAVCDLMILLSPDANGCYGFSAQDWDCGRIEIWVDAQKVQNPVGVSIISSMATSPAEVHVLRRDPVDASKTVRELFLADMVLVERKVK